MDFPTHLHWHNLHLPACLYHMRAHWACTCACGEGYCFCLQVCHSVTFALPCLPCITSHLPVCHTSFFSSLPHELAWTKRMDGVTHCTHTALPSCHTHTFWFCMHALLSHLSVPPTGSDLHPPCLHMPVSALYVHACLLCLLPATAPTAPTWGFCQGILLEKLSLPSLSQTSSAPTCIFLFACPCPQDPLSRDSTSLLLW